MPALKAIISGDADPLRKELLEIQRLADQTGRRIQSGISGGGHGGINSGAVRESLVVTRELMRGDISHRLPGSILLLSQRLGLLKYVFRSVSDEEKELAAQATKTAAATALQADTAFIAAEANLAEARAEHLSEYADKEKTSAALVAAAAKRYSTLATRTETAAAYESAKAQEAATLATKASLTPLAWWAAALIAVGVAAYFLIKHLKTVADEARNLARLLDVVTIKFSDQAEALKESSQAAQEFDDWLKKIHSTEEGLAEQVDETIGAMREQAKFEQELAKKKGATPQQVAQMEIDAAKKQLEYVKAAALAAEQKAKFDETSARIAGNQAISPDLKGKIKTVSENSKLRNKIVEAITKSLETERVAIMVPIPGMPAAVTASSRAATASDPIDVKVDGDNYSMSLNAAKKIADEMNAEDRRLLAIQKQLADLAAEKKKLTEKDLEDQKRLQKEQKKLEDDIAIKSKYLPLLEDATKHKAEHGSVNELQRIGGLPVFGMLDIQRKSLGHLASIDHHIKTNRLTNPGAVRH